MTYPLVPLKRVLSRNEGGVWGEEPAGLADSPVLRSTDQSSDGHWLDVEPAMRSLTLLERLKARLFVGDLLLTKSSGSAQHIGKTTLVTEAIAQGKPAFSNFMQRLRIRPDNSSKFYWYCFRSTYIRDQVNLISTTSTGLANLTASTIDDLLVPFPQAPVQQQIADYLDAQTAKIDVLIGKQEQLIETLAERRRAVISHAVTKGLNPNIPMRNSGVNWVGAIPSTWRSLPLFATVRERFERNIGMKETNLLSLSYGEIVRKDLASNDGLLPDSFETYQIVKPFDVVLRLTDLQNDKRSLRSAIVGEQGIITSAYLVLTPTKYVPRYFAYMLRVYDISKVFYSMGGGLRQSMNFADLKHLPVLMPPNYLQQEIADYLDRETAHIDAVVAKARDMIDVLKERRQALISAAVTGKIDVRTASGA